VVVDYGKDPDLVVDEPFRLKFEFHNLFRGPRHIELKWHLPAGLRVLSNEKHIALGFRDTHEILEVHEMTVDVVADESCSGTVRGALEVVANGRPTVGLVPLLFFSSK
jgi:hypothetical protein